MNILNTLYRQLSSYTPLILFISLLTNTQAKVHIKMQKIITPKKIEVYFIPLPKTNIVSAVFMLLKTGSIYHKQGALELLGDCLQKCNSSQISGEEYENAQIENGFSLTVNSNQDNLQFSLTYIKNIEDLIIKHMKERFFKLKFDDFDIIKRTQISALENVYNLPENKLKRTAYNTMFGNHPYRYSLSPEHLKELQVNDIIKVYKNLFNKCNLKIIISGDLKKSDVIKITDTIFADIPNCKKNTKNNTFTKVDLPKLTKDLSIPGDGKGYNNIVFYKNYVSNGRTIKNFAIEQLAMLFATKSQIAAKLPMDLRNAGLAYYAIMNINTKDYSEYFYGMTASKSYIKTKYQILKSIQKYRNGITKEELTDNKHYLRSILINKVLKPSDYTKIIAYALEIGLEHDFFNQYLKAIEEVSLSELNDFISKNFDPEAFSFIYIN